MPMTEGGYTPRRKPKKNASPYRKLGPQAPNVGYTPSEREAEGIISRELVKRLGGKKFDPFSRVTEDFARMPGEIWDTINALGGEAQRQREMGNQFAEADVLGEVGRAQLEQYADWAANPTEFLGYLGDNPADTLLMAAGGIGYAPRVLGGGKALLAGAARRGDWANTADWLGSEVGAIGPIGRRMEAGDFGEVIPARLDPTIRADIGRKGISDTDTGIMFYPDESLADFVMLKPAGGQMLPEEINSIINEATGNRLYAPAGVVGRGQFVPTTGPNKGILNPDAEMVALEFSHKAEQLKKWEDLGPATRVEDMRNMNIWDAVAANMDRTYGHNMMVTTEGRLLPIDYGIAWHSSKLNPGQGFFDPRAWSGQWTLSPSEIEWLENIKGVLSDAFANPTSRLGSKMRSAGGERSITQALGRIDQMLQAGYVHVPTRKLGGIKGGRSLIPHDEFMADAEAQAILNQLHGPAPTQAYAGTPGWAKPPPPAPPKPPTPPTPVPTPSDVKAMASGPDFLDPMFVKDWRFDQTKGRWVRRQPGAANSVLAGQALPSAPPAPPSKPGIFPFEQRKMGDNTWIWNHKENQWSMVRSSSSEVDEGITPMPGGRSDPAMEPNSEDWLPTPSWAKSPSTPRTPGGKPLGSFEGQIKKFGNKNFIWTKGKWEPLKTHQQFNVGSSQWQ